MFLVKRSMRFPYLEVAFDKEEEKKKKGVHE